MLRHHHRGCPRLCECKTGRGSPNTNFYLNRVSTTFMMVLVVTPCLLVNSRFWTPCRRRTYRINFPAILITTTRRTRHRYYQPLNYSPICRSTSEAPLLLTFELFSHLPFDLRKVAWEQSLGFLSNVCVLPSNFILSRDVSLEVRNLYSSLLATNIEAREVALQKMPRTRP